MTKSDTCIICTGPTSHHRLPHYVISVNLSVGQPNPSGRRTQVAPNHRVSWPNAPAICNPCTNAIAKAFFDELFISEAIAPNTRL